jgi:hypothetical protein
MTDTKTLIHVRFAPNGGVTEISERPAALTPQDWFDTLSTRAGNSYQPLAGGRGIFRVTSDELVTLKQLAL